MTAAEALAGLGPFFAVEVHRGGAPPAPWQAMSAIAADPGVLRDRVTAVRAALAAGGGQPAEAVEARVAASVAHLGLVARVVSPVLGLAVLRGELLPGLDLAGLRWQPVLGGPFPLSLPADAVAAARPAAGPRALTEGLARHLLDGPVRDLVAAFGPLRVSPRILWGNAASAVNGAAAMVAAARPACAGGARALAAGLLARPPLRGAGSGAAGTGGFRRRSCCLVYRAAPGRGGALCGDCLLRTGRPGPSR